MCASRPGAVRAAGGGERAGKSCADDSCADDSCADDRCAVVDPGQQAGQRAQRDAVLRSGPRDDVGAA